MTFKQFQEEYIKCFKDKKHIDAPKTLWEDHQKVYDTLLQQSNYAMEQLGSSNTLTFKDRIDAAALIDFCTIRCINIINNYKDVCNMISNYNREVDANNTKKS